MAVTQVLGIVLVWLSLMKNVEIYSLNVDGSGREKSKEKEKLLQSLEIIWKNLMCNSSPEFELISLLHRDCTLRATDQVVADLEWLMLSDPDLEGRSV